MDGWADGWLDGWTDPSVVRAQEVQEQVGVVAEQAKKWQLPCKRAWTLAVWLCLTLFLAGSCEVQQYKSRSCLLLSSLGSNIRARKTRFCGGSCRAVGAQPLSLSPLAFGLGMHEMAYPSQDSISPSTPASLTACLLLSRGAFLRCTPAGHLAGDQHPAATT